MKKSLFALLIGILAVVAISMTNSTNTKQNLASTEKMQELETLQDIDLQELASELEFEKIMDVKYNQIEDGAYEAEFSILIEGEIQKIQRFVSFGQCGCSCYNPNPRYRGKAVRYNGLCWCGKACGGGDSDDM